MSRVAAGSVVAATVDAVLMRRAGVPVWAIQRALVARYSLTVPVANRLVDVAMRRLAEVAQSVATDAQADCADVAGCYPVRWARPDGRS